MVSDLRKLDEEIATMRGWERVKRTSGILLPGDAWIAPACGRGWHGVRWVDCDGVQVLGYLGHDPPPFSSSWALAGVLLQEMPCPDLCAHVGGWYCCTDTQGRRDMRSGDGASPCGAIARAWVAWRRGRA